MLFIYYNLKIKKGSDDWYTFFDLAAAETGKIPEDIMAKGKIPFFSYEEIRNRADDFLRQYHPSREILIPIEEIAEFQMGLNIVPIPELLRAFDVDGFTSSDLSNIYVDEFIYSNRPGRYRFTLAHEVGHIILHKEIYSKANFQNIKEWKDFINSISDKDHIWLEYHAYTFGGLVLVPGEHLIRLTEFYVNRIQKEDIPLRENWGQIGNRYHLFYLFRASYRHCL